jgi:hypothetical protein
VYLRPGLTLRRTTSAAQFVVIRGGDGDVDLRCGDAPLAGPDQPDGPSAGAGGDGPALEVGKRYGDVDGTVELLCTRPGAGPLTLAGTPLAPRAAKSLPSSD